MTLLGIRRVGLRLLSIGVAALLWFLIPGQQVAERALRIPLEFTNLPRELEMSGDTPTVVDVRIRGSSATLSRVAPGELVAVLDLQAARPGRRLFHITDADVRTPFGLEVVQVTPSNVSMNFEVSSSKVVRVSPAVEGEPASGFVIQAIESRPDTVEVVGPPSALKNLTEALTEPVSVQGATQTVRENVTIGLPDPTVRLRTAQSAAVTVEVTTARLRTVSDLTITPHGDKTQAVVLRPTRVAALVSGPRDIVDNLSGSDLDAVVEVEGLGSGQYELGVRVNAPRRVTVVQVDPPHVNVRVR